VSGCQHRNAALFLPFLPSVSVSTAGARSIGVRDTLVRLYKWGGLGAGVLLAVAACGTRGCAVSKPLNSLFGGGAAVCLGAPFSAVERQDGRVDDPAASLPSVALQEKGVLYSYEPGGGLDLVVWRPGARIERACATYPDARGGEAAALGESWRSTLRGSWRAASSSPEVDLWTRDDGLSVGVRNKSPYTVCLDAKL
jgi:hypothetical protein